MSFSWLLCKGLKRIPQSSTTVVFSMPFLTFFPLNYQCVLLSVLLFLIWPFLMVQIYFDGLALFWKSNDGYFHQALKAPVCDHSKWIQMQVPHMESSPKPFYLLNLYRSEKEKLSVRKMSHYFYTFKNRGLCIKIAVINSGLEHCLTPPLKFIISHG